MNSYISSQISNIILTVQIFEQSCHMAATEDNGQLDRSEIKALKKISAATQHFIKDLEKIK